MSEKTTAKSPAPTSTSKPKADGGKAELQQAHDEANEQGYWGITTDPTPDANYTVAGVTSGKPTPETDKDAALAARKEAGFR